MQMEEESTDMLFSGMAHLIDKASPVPLYFQISEALMAGIEKERLDPNTRIPPEDQLARMFGVSKMTMRQALGKLVNDGVLVRRKGSGTFIAETKIEREATRLVSFYEDIKKKGLNPESDVLEKRVIAPAHKLRETLRLKEKDLIVKIIRLRKANDVPMAVNHAYIPEKFCPGLMEEALSQVSLSRLMEEKYQLNVAYAVQTVRAVKATPQEAALLQIKAGDPVLSMERTMFDSSQRPLCHYVNFFKSDTYAFHSVLYK